MHRREFLLRAGAVVGGVSLLSKPAWAQDTTAAAAAAAPAPVISEQPQAATAAGGEEMTSDSYKPVVRPPKPGAKPTMTVKQLEDFERQLACPCPCTLDVYTCRTTDFACGISPAVHGDIQRLVDGGYTGDEIMQALTGTYGDFILNSPRKEGFSLVAWFAPFAAVAVGGVGIGALLRSWRLNAKEAEANRPVKPAASLSSSGTDATPDELARLEAALREDN
ncbi:cytochrome c-type biogenesis protein CcmH [Gemmatimonas sp.]|uniref:cytochrome c-type biogenesis protein CcmH n=1 Tax=Gemmatimonas sp. TaxID=1962908 RepID=UPI0033407339